MRKIGKLCSRKEKNTSSNQEEYWAKFVLL
jgi:hypothetical protein